MRRSGMQVMMRLVGLVKPLAGFMVLAVAMGTLGHLCATFIPVFAGYSLLHAIRYPSILSMGWLMALMVLLAFARALLKYGEQACNHYIAFRLLALIRDRVFKALRRLSPAKLEGRDRGDLISLITSDVELLEVFYAHTISPVCIAIIYTVAMTAFIGAHSLALGMMAVFSYLAIGVALPMLTSQRSGKIGYLLRKESGALSSLVLDNMRGLREIIQYEKTDSRMNRMKEATDDLLLLQEEAKQVEGRNSAETGVLIYFFDVLFVIAAATLHGRGQISFGEALVTSLCFLSSFGPVSALAMLGSTLSNTIAAGNRVLDILDDVPLTKEITGMEEVSFNGAALKDVGFAYGTENILDRFSLDVPGGKAIGIFGPSGVGKSTVLKLLMRFWDVQQGSVEIAGRNVKQINTSNLRDMEGFMRQETYLFHDTIKNNIRIGRLNATDEEIKEACRKASIDEFIASLTNGYDTQVGELGDTLSSGEAQRIGLARVFLHDAPLILLDEPVASLDALNEGVILRSLKEETIGKTIVLVSHRASALRICNETISMESDRAV